MTMATEMTVSVRLPTQTLYQGTASRLYAVAENGAFGMLPNHIDFVTALVPSVFIVIATGGEELIFGIDEGILVKKGHQVDVAVRRGVRGEDLASIKDTVYRNFIAVDEDERVARSALSRLEAGIVRRFADLQKPQP
ncbi:ATPase [Marinobacter sp. M216]|uniref:ATP synthase epsilon chain n=1 Tax=Marinobacter albus TaxID=3030833 RepID=A0ABT7HE39_9GAMM|nr:MULTISPECIES: ATPase [unclassified Marinobacter]MBW7472056.1 ATPase [Marinobacter sp. F4218]MDK9558626.1 ATPase [Marinobacter sp. M216]